MKQDGSSDYTRRTSRAQTQCNRRPKGQRPPRPQGGSAAITPHTDWTITAASSMERLSRRATAADEDHFWKKKQRPTNREQKRQLKLDMNSVEKKRNQEKTQGVLLSAKLIGRFSISFSSRLATYSSSIALRLVFEGKMRTGATFKHRWPFFKKNNFLVSSFNVHSYGDDQIDNKTTKADTPIQLLAPLFSNF